jgi:hypothetical protein
MYNILVETRHFSNSHQIVDEYQQGMDVGFEVLIAVIMRRNVFWAATLCSSERTRNFWLSPNYTALQPIQDTSHTSGGSYKLH